MVSAPERSELLHGFGLTVLDLRVQVAELSPCVPVSGLVGRITVFVKTHRYHTFDLVTKLSQFTLENSALERRFHGHHSTADIDTDGRRNNSVLSRDN